MKKNIIISISLFLVFWHVTFPQNNTPLLFETPQKNIEIENVGDSPYQSLQFFIKSSANAQFQPVSSTINELLVGRKITILVDITEITIPPDSKATLYLFAGNELLYSQNIVLMNTLPTSFRLLQNYPNPFNSSTVISYTIPISIQNIKTNLSIYDISGKLVKTLVDGIQSTGHYTIHWNGTNNEGIPLASGIYYCHLRVGTFWKTLKLTLIK